jgi:hypothetical protein
VIGYHDVKFAVLKGVRDVFDVVKNITIKQQALVGHIYGMDFASQRRVCAKVVCYSARAGSYFQHLQRLWSGR